MILSASRRTDIPNYYSDWFLNRIKEGYLYVKNPMNPHQISNIDLSPDIIDCIVFWTKNPANILPSLPSLDAYKYYFQFTLTGYDKDIEPNLPDKKDKLIPTFKRLSEAIGKERVVWRYDPILLNDKYTMEYHIQTFADMAYNLRMHTEKVIISFIDIYAKIKNNTVSMGIKAASSDQMLQLAAAFAQIAKVNHLTIETCAEIIELKNLGIQHGSCIDKNLIEKIIGCNLKVKKDSNQREECGCYESIDIGIYNTCLNGCKYCYANYSNGTVAQNSNLYDSKSPVLCSTIGEEDKITRRKIVSLKETQLSLFDYKSK